MCLIPLKIWAIELVGPIHLGFEAWALPGGDKKTRGMSNAASTGGLWPLPQTKISTAGEQQGSGFTLQEAKVLLLLFQERKKNEWVEQQSFSARSWNINPSKASAGMETQAAGWASGEVGITQLPLKHSVTQHPGDSLPLNKTFWGFLYKALFFFTHKSDYQLFQQEKKEQLDLEKCSQQRMCTQSDSGV